MSIGALADQILEMVRTESQEKTAAALPAERVNSAPVTELGQILFKLAADLRRISGSEGVSIQDLENFVRSGR